MPNTYYVAQGLDGEQIEAALTAIDGVVTQENNGKILAIEDGVIVAKSASEWTDTPVLQPLSATANGDYVPESGVDGFNSVHVAVPGAGNIEPITITANGTFSPPTGVDGYAPVTVNVDGGQLNWHDSFVVNWDFSHPVNTRGAASYSGSSLIYTIDGWQLQDGILEFATGGIRLSQRTAGPGYFMQRFKISMTNAIVGQTMTLSAMVDGDVAFATADPIPSASGSSGFGFHCSGVGFRGYGYGSEIAITIDIGTDTINHIIQAIKLEAGNTQTLATQVNGVWVLNNSMDAETEYIKARNGTVYNS